jgi:hypothetical protein
LSHTSNPFCSGYFGDEVLLFAWAGLDFDPPIFMLRLSLGKQTGMHHHAQLFSIEMGSHKFFCLETCLQTSLA